MTRHKAVARAVTANLALSVIAIVAQAAVTMVIARILQPRDFGVFAFSNAILVYVSHLTQRGLASAISRRDELAGDGLASAYSACAIIAAAGAVILAVISLVLASLPHGKYAQQASLLAFLAIPLALEILASPATAVLQQRLQYVSLSVISLTSYGLGNGLVTAICGALNLGPWSLALGNVTNVLLTTAASVLAARVPLRFSLDARRVAQTLRQGLAFNGLRSLDIAWLQAPVLILTFYRPAELVGIYQRMQFMADLTMQMTVWRVSTVIYSALAPGATLRTISVGRYRLISLILSTLTLPIVAFSVVASEPIVGSLLGRRWLAGAPTFQILSIAFGLSALNHAPGMTLEHAGRLGPRYLSSLVALATCVGLVLLFRFATGAGLAFPAAISMAVGTAILYVSVGERFAIFGNFLGRLAPGAFLAIASATGAILGGAISARLGMANAPEILCWQLGCAALLNVAALPLVVRMQAVEAIVEMAREHWPAAHRAIGIFRGRR